MVNQEWNKLNGTLLQLSEQLFDLSLLDFQFKIPSSSGDWKLYTNRFSFKVHDIPLDSGLEIEQNRLLFKVHNIPVDSGIEIETNCLLFNVPNIPMDSGLEIEQNHL